MEDWYDLTDEIVKRNDKTCGKQTDATEMGGAAGAEGCGHSFEDINVNLSDFQEVKSP